jgi:hypothetical protein
MIIPNAFTRKAVAKIVILFGYGKWGKNLGNFEKIYFLCFTDLSDNQCVDK